jgi:hypothetical protein
MVVSNKADVYAFHRSMAAIEKFSFHASGICRHAFVATRPLPDAMTDRVLDRWTRAPTPPPGSGAATPVLTVIFPTSHLTMDAPASGKATYLAAAAEGNSTIVRMLFTRDDEGALIRQSQGGQWALVTYFPLPSGEALALLRLEDRFEGPTLIQDRTGTGDDDDIVLPAAPTPSIPRPVLFTLTTRPEETVCWELSGFRLKRGFARALFPDADMIRNTIVLDKTARSRPD